MISYQHNIPVYILAGGKSTRFGSDKARFVWKEKALLQWVAQPFFEFTQTVTVVANQTEKYRDLGFETIADPKPGLGPLGGIFTALLDLQKKKGSGFLLCASCDRLGIQPSWIRILFQQIHQQAEIIGFRKEIWEPFPALYHSSLLPKVDLALQKNQLTPWKLVQQVPHIALPLPSDWPLALDVNSPEDLLKFPD